MTYLLPRSGVGVWPPWLVIAPGCNPPIRLDLRMLDSIEHASERDEVEPDAVILVLGDLEVALHIADGEDAAARIVREAAPFTRELGGSAAPAVPTARERGASLLVIVPPTPILDGRRFDIAWRRMTIGFGEENDIVIEHPSISRAHAAIVCDPETNRYTIENLGSSNQVRVNGRPHSRIELHTGDIVDLGHVRMRFDDPAEDAPTSAPGGALVVVGDDAVRQLGDLVQVGECAFLIDEVREYALHGGNLPLPGGHLLQAAMALLVVEAETEKQPPPLGITFERRRSYIREIRPGSIADAAGLRVGDELVSVSITSEMVMRFRRGDDRIALPIPPDELPERVEQTRLIGLPAPSFTATTLDGADLSLRDLVGRVVLLDFWGTSCKPEERVRRLSAIQNEHPELRVVGVSTEPCHHIRRFLESNPATYRLVDDADRSISTRYVAEPPMLVVIDEEGVVRRVELGPGDVDTFAPW